MCGFSHIVCLNLYLENGLHFKCSHIYLTAILIECSYPVVCYYLNNYKIPVKTQYIMSIMLYSIIDIAFNNHGSVHRSMNQ